MSTPGYTVDKLAAFKISLWIRLRNVPMELFTTEEISHIASAVGTPLCMNKATKNWRRIQLARACVKK